MAREQKPDKQQPKQNASAYGSGTVYQRNDGRWVASMKDPNSGKRIDRYAKTEKDAKKKLDDIKFEIRQGTLATGPRQTVEQYLMSWLEDVDKQEIRVTTYAHHYSVLHKHLIPAFGHIQMKSLTAQHVQKFYTSLVKDGYKPSSISRIHSVFHKALKNAVHWKIVSFNVCDQVTLPRDTGEQESGQALTVDQAVQLLKISQGHPLEALIALALVGLRHGEIRALRWQDINLEEKRLSVNKTVTHLWGRGFVEGPPKTKKSKRDIILPQFVADSLLRHHERQAEARQKAGSRWQEKDLVFCNRYGGYLDPSRTLKRFHDLLESAGLPRIRIHDLRHSAASLLIVALKMPQKLVQEMLGHSDLDMTWDYTHTDESQQRQMMDDFDDFLKDKM